MTNTSQYFLQKLQILIVIILTTATTAIIITMGVYCRK